jgi:hypothetical protein
MQSRGGYAEERRHAEEMQRENKNTAYPPRLPLRILRDIAFSI